MRKRLLTSTRRQRATVVRGVQRWTDPQQSVIDSDKNLLVWWGANGIGKSMLIGHLTKLAIAGALHWQTPGPQSVILCGNTWMQLGSTLRYFMQGVDPSWFRKGIRYEGGGMKGQRLQVFDIVGGPGKGGELRCGTFRAANLAGPRADAVITDEPLPRDVYNELFARLLGRNGRMYQTFTPTLGTSHKLGYLWDLVDDDTKPWAGEIQTPLTLAAVTPRGGLYELPWMRQTEIDRMEEGISAIEADMRLGRTRSPRLDSAFFSAWGPHLLSDERPPDGTPVGIGLDHGSKPGAQRASMSAVGGKGLYAKVWTLAEYKGNGRTESEQDARGVMAMLEGEGMTIWDVDLWVGDRAHHGDRMGGKKSNHRFQQAVAKELGHNVSGRGWLAKLPKALQRMQTPRKYDRSVWEGCDILHRLMVGENPRLKMSPKCRHLREDIENWQGSKIDPAKDSIDSWRYHVVPMVEGTRR